MALTPNPAGGGGGKKSGTPVSRVPTPKGGGLTANPALGKGGGGLLSHIPKPVTGLLGAAGSALSMPQQVAFKAGRGIGDIVTGQPGAGGKALLGALGEVATLGQAGGDISFAEAAGRYDPTTKSYVPAKLPKGVNTALGIVTDPLNFVTFGAGAAAKQATKVAAKELGTEAATRIATQGLKKGLTVAEKDTLKSALVRSAEEAGVRNAERTAEKQLKQLAVRGRGGVTARIPFTKAGVSLLPGETATKIGEATGLTSLRDLAQASGPARFLGKALIPGRAVSEAVGGKAAEEVLGIEAARGAAGTAHISDQVTRVKSALSDFKSKAGRAFTADDDAFVHRALESGDLAGAKTARPELGRVIDTFDDMRKSLGQEQVATGVLSPDALRDEATYLHRLFTPEAQSAFAKMEKQTVSGGGSVSSALAQGAAKARTIAPEYTAREINAAIETLQQGGTVADDALADATKRLAQSLKPGEKLYQESAVASLLDRGVEGAKAIATARSVGDMRGVLDDTGQRILVSADDVAQGAAVPKDWVKFDLGKLGTFHAPSAVKDELTKFTAILGQDDVIGKFQTFLRQADKWWRTQATASLPGGVPFAARNARSNLMLTFMDGMPARYLKRGIDFQRRVHRIEQTFPADIADEGVEAVMRRQLGGADFGIWKAAREKGVIGDGFYRIDITGAPRIAVKGAATTGGRVRRTGRFLAGTEGGLATKGRELNQAIEQHARLSHFLYSVDRLGDLGEAAKRTNTVLFDYARVTPFEQRVVKKVVPFWTFMRKNTPAQFRALVDNPGRYVLPEKAASAVTGPLPEGSPEYQQRQGYRVSKLPGLAGLVTKPERPFQAAVAAVEPLAQLAAAIIPGKQGPLEPAGGFPQALRSMTGPAGGIPIAPAKAIFEEATGKSLYTGYNLTPDEARQRLLLAALPAVGHSGPLAGYLPSSVVPRSKKKLPPALAQLAKMLGITLTPETKPQ